MKKYWVLFLISISIFIIFLSFNLTLNNKKLDPDRNIIEDLKSFKYELEKTINVFENYNFILSNYPEKKLTDANNKILTTLNNMLIELNKESMTVADVAILDNKNNTAFSMPGVINFSSVEDNYLTLNNKQTIFRKLNDKYILVLKGIYSVNGSLIGKVVITYDKHIIFPKYTYKVESFENYNVLSRKTNILDKSILEEIITDSDLLITPLNKVSIKFFKNKYIIYSIKTKGYLNFICLDEYSKPVDRNIFDIILLIIGIIVIFAFALIIFNMYFLRKKEIFDNFCVDLFKKLDKCA